MIRFFITPNVSARMSTSQQMCWRKCGHLEADHTHIFWACPKMKEFWGEVWRAITKILGYQIPNSCKTLYLGNLDLNMIQREDEYLTKILLIAAKKTITRLWFKEDSPTLRKWTWVVEELYVMEEMTHRITF